VLVARRRDRLEALRDELASAHDATSEIVAMDLAEPGAGTRLHELVVERGLAVDYLVNNAGFGAVGRFDRQDWERSLSMIRVNIVALAELTHRFVGDMVERGSGRVLNVASVAGFVPGPLQATYYASKAFVVSFSEALDAELAGTGVTVTALCPGMTATEFHDGAHMRGTGAMRFPRAAASGVARAGYDGMLRGRRLVVPGLMNKLIVHVGPRVLPRRLATWASMELLRKRA
jgi:short-subunit dehydrogenase